MDHVSFLLRSRIFEAQNKVEPYTAYRLVLVLCQLLVDFRPTSGFQNSTQSVNIVNTMDEIKYYSFNELRAQIRVTERVLADLQKEKAEKAADNDALPAVLAKIVDREEWHKKAKDAVYKMAMDQGPTETETKISVDPKAAIDRKLTMLLADVPKFDGAGPEAIHNFLIAVDQIYDNNVSTEPNLEPIFAQAVKNRLTADVYNVMRNSGKPLTTYSELKEWLEIQYQTKVTTFQLLGKVFDFVFEKDENFIQKAQKLENQIRATESHIKAHHKKKHDKEITVTELLNLVGAQVLTEHVRRTDTKIIGHMALHMEDFATASDVARHAEQIVNRSGETPTSEKTAFRVESAKSKGKHPKGKGKGDGKPKGQNKGKDGNYRGNRNRRYNSDRNSHENRDNRDNRDNREYRDNRDNRGYQNDRDRNDRDQNRKRHYRSAHVAENDRSCSRSRSPSVHYEGSRSPRLQNAVFH